MQDVKHVLILGGTGTLGTSLIETYKKVYPHVKVTVASRSEHKQYELSKKYPWVKFVLCDIRDRGDVNRVCRGQDIVVHVAALKHVDILEENPLDSIKTNVMGTINVAHACISNRVKYCLFSSTDKAVDPINVYGYCKALSEKILLNYNNKQMTTRFNVFRWGNVIGSQGSAIPFFVKLVKEGKDVPITSLEMSRFWIKIEDASLFMIENYNRQNDNKIIIPKGMRAATVLRVVQAIGRVLNRPVAMKEIGLRKGEKLYESLASSHRPHPIDSMSALQYSDKELEDMLREFC